MVHAVNKQSSYRISHAIRVSCSWLNVGVGTPESRHQVPVDHEGALRFDLLTFTVDRHVVLVIILQ